VSTLIKGGRAIDDSWAFAGTTADVPERRDVLVPLPLWSAERHRLAERPGRVGVLLGPADDPAEIAGDLPRLALVAVDFPQFADGRGYSIARLLRERHGYSGELRAVGDVGRDQLFYLARVGFDAFALRDGEDVDGALTAFADFSEAYQASVERPQPLFRRRADGSAAGVGAPGEGVPG
jgi:uncharacterized protein (DUF934 family)